MLHRALYRSTWGVYQWCAGNVYGLYAGPKGREAELQVCSVVARYVQCVHELTMEGHKGRLWSKAI
jgi:hypothetical protein